MRRPPSTTRTDTPFPYPTCFRSPGDDGGGGDPISLRVRSSRRSRWWRCPTRASCGWRPGSCGCSTHQSTYQWSHSAPSWAIRSEEHTSELQSLMRISYAVFCLKKKNKTRVKTEEHKTNIIDTTQSHRTK